MIFWTIVRVAFKSLRANKLRSVLAMLGIIIAVWSVIAALALGAGAQASVLNRLSALGTNLLVIVPAQRASGGVSTGTQQTLRIEDAQALLSIPEISHVAPVVRGGAQMKYLNKNTSASVL
ncbi:MAG TPA: ABC transporter permease, partial [Tepidisphaeraceae bacterium]